MQALILAAGRGTRLRNAPEAEGAGVPKCLLEIGGHSLLSRHIKILNESGVTRIGIVTGYQHHLIESALLSGSSTPAPDLLYNPRFELGSIISLQRGASWAAPDRDLILMDADVLYHPSIVAALTGDGSPNRVLYDRKPDLDAEAVKLCLREGCPVEFGKEVDPEVCFDTIGESVGFFRLGAATAATAFALAAELMLQGEVAAPYELILRDLLIEQEGSPFQSIDITGLPWIEIDFPEDLELAHTRVWPLLQALPNHHSDRPVPQ